MKNILDYLEETEKKYFYKSAVDDGNIRMTWHDLTDMARRIGTAITKKTVPGKPIAILAEKSAPVLAAMFGTVYAGCFYVMINPRQPAERIKTILSELQPEMVITIKEYGMILDEIGFSGEKQILWNMMKTEIDGKILYEVREQMRDTDILYCIFTSGSTGKPKGIIVSQRAVIDFISHFVALFEITDKERIANQAPFDFDVSVKDIYSSVMTGAQLILIPAKLFSMPPMLLDYLCEKQVTTLIWAVSALTLISSLKGLRYKVPENVKKIMFSGEVMPVGQLKQWQTVLPNAKFVNLYGPSEITCNCTFYPVTRIFGENEKIPIGKAFPGRYVFLLDENGNRIEEEGKTGEICVAGESLSEGYYRNPDETEKRFFFYSLQEAGKVRCYRTGDMGFLGKDGNLFFAGRKDFQIKHMGHRIELEEIEAAMNRAEGVEKSCCLIDRAHEKIIAFYQGEVDEEIVRRKMKEYVPAYMIPHKILHMEQIPLNKNGKTDRGYLQKRLEEG